MQRNNKKNFSAIFLQIFWPLQQQQKEEKMIHYSAQKKFIFAEVNFFEKWLLNKTFKDLPISLTSCDTLLVM